MCFVFGSDDDGILFVGRFFAVVVRFVRSDDDVLFSPNESGGSAAAKLMASVLACIIWSRSAGLEHTYIPSAILVNRRTKVKYLASPGG